MRKCKLSLKIVQNILVYSESTKLKKNYNLEKRIYNR